MPPWRACGRAASGRRRRVWKAFLRACQRVDDVSDLGRSPLPGETCQVLVATRDKPSAQFRILQQTAEPLSQRGRVLWVD